tara:strand:- start:2240 stop:2386 length:147 start_codon:yes stop_codon:yes gene_type:complete
MKLVEPFQAGDTARFCDALREVCPTKNGPVRPAGVGKQKWAEGGMSGA